MNASITNTIKDILERKAELEKREAELMKQPETEKLLEHKAALQNLLKITNELLENYATDDWNQEGDDGNVFTETCDYCGEHLGGRKDWTEEEFDEHEDRDEGYDEAGVWWCPTCRVKGPVAE